MKTLIVVGLVLIAGFAEGQNRTTVISKPGDYPTTVREWDYNGGKTTIVQHSNDYPIVANEYGTGSRNSGTNIFVTPPQSNNNNAVYNVLAEAYGWDKK